MVGFSRRGSPRQGIRDNKDRILGSIIRLRGLAGVAVWALAAALGLAVLSAHGQSWTNTALAPEDRANLLIAQMTLDEKIAMVHGVNGQYVGDTTNNARLGIPALHLQDGPA